MSKKEEIFNNYDAFVEKFKPKKTTDDCHTPSCVYDAVLGWLRRNTDIAGRPVVRPFWPGQDYTKAHYPGGCVVVDNPPFSILAQILRYYDELGIHYFLFAPHLTLFSNNKGRRTYIVTATTNTYENGAKVCTTFKTNLPDFADYCVIGSPELRQAINEAQLKNRKEEKKEKNELPVYSYPDHVVTVSKVASLVNVGLELRIKKESAVFLRRMDAQRPIGKGIFGAGLLVSDAAAEKLREATSKIEELKAEKLRAEKLRAEKLKEANRFELSEAERSIINQLNENEQRHQQGA